MQQLSSSREKLIRQLHSPQGRKKNRYLLVEGMRGVGTMLQAGVEPEFVVISPQDLTQPGEEFVRNLSGRNLHLFEADRKRFRALSEAVVAQGIMAVAAESQLPSADSRWPSARLILLLDGVSDPGNVGTIIRTAAACRVDILALSPGCADILNPKVIRATAGTLFTQPVIRISTLETFFGQLQSNNVALAGSDARSQLPLDQLETASGSICLAFGSEADGLSGTVRGACDTFFRLRGAPEVESFNVAAAAAIATYDVAARMKLI